MKACDVSRKRLVVASMEGCLAPVPAACAGAQSESLCLLASLSACFLSSLSSSIMWWQRYCFQTGMLTAISSPGTGWCCFTVRHVRLHGQGRLWCQVLLVPLSFWEELQQFHSGGARVVLECSFSVKPMQLAFWAFVTWPFVWQPPNYCLVTFYIVIKHFN